MVLNNRMRCLYFDVLEVEGGIIEKKEGVAFYETFPYYVFSVGTTLVKKGIVLRSVSKHV